MNDTHTGFIKLYPHDIADVFPCIYLYIYINVMIYIYIFKVYLSYLLHRRVFIALAYIYIVLQCIALQYIV
jgi:hypothetical protein